MIPEKRNSPTWERISVTALFILITIAGYAYTDTQSKIKDLDQRKADKEIILIIRQDVSDIKTMMLNHMISSGYMKNKKNKVHENENYQE